MAKRPWTDAKFEVIEGPRRRYELPQWFKTTALWAAAVYGLVFMVWTAMGHPMAPPVAGQDAAPAALTAPASR